MSLIKNNDIYLIKGFPSYTNYKLIPKYIIIHDTAGQSSAYQEAKRLQSSSQYNNGIAHYYIDESNCYQLIYDTVKAYHAGDGEFGKGNGQSLSIEVCRSLPGGNFTSSSQKETYKKALERAYMLAADLCNQYGINPNNILQHRECSSTACPYTQKVLYGSYEKAKSEAKRKVSYYKNGGNTMKTHYYCKVIHDSTNIKNRIVSYDLENTNSWGDGKINFYDTFKEGKLGKSLGTFSKGSTFQSSGGIAWTKTSSDGSRYFIHKVYSPSKKIWGYVPYKKEYK